jgi:hypothetical protein
MNCFPYQNRSLSGLLLTLMISTHPQEMVGDYGLDTVVVIVEDDEEKVVPQEIRPSAALSIQFILPKMKSNADAVQS